MLLKISSLGSSFTECVSDHLQYLFPIFKAWTVQFAMNTKLNQNNTDNSHLLNFSFLQYTLDVLGHIRSEVQLGHEVYQYPWDIWYSRWECSCCGEMVKWDVKWLENTHRRWWIPQLLDFTLIASLAVRIEKHKCHFVTSSDINEMEFTTSRMDYPSSNLPHVCILTSFDSTFSSFES